MSAHVYKLGLFILVAQYVIRVKLQKTECGVPGRPAHGHATVLKSSFPVGYKIQYECEQKFVIVGNSVRECTDNGTWNGQVPFCVDPSPNIKFSQSIIPSCGGKPFTRSIDGDDETCVTIYVNGSRTWWAMNLSNLPDVTILEMIVKGYFPIEKSNLTQNLQVYLLDKTLDYSDSKHLRCEKTPKVKWEKYSLRLRPNRPKGRYLYLKSDDPVKFSYLRICEVILITKEDSQFFCGDPEVPLNGIVERAERHTATYKCQPDYELLGPQVRTCNDSSIWSTPVPQCIPKVTTLGVSLFTSFQATHNCQAPAYHQSSQLPSATATVTILPIVNSEEHIAGPYLYIAIGMGIFFVLFVIGFAFYFCHMQRRVSSETKNASFSVITNSTSVGETLFNDNYCGSVFDALPYTITNQYADTTQHDVIATSSRRNSRLPSCSSSSDRRASLRSDSPSKRISFCRVSSGSREKPPLEIQRVYSNNSIQLPDGPHIYSEIYEDPVPPTPMRRSTLLSNSSGPSSPVVLNPVYLDPDDANTQKTLPIYTEPYGTTQI